MATFVCLHGAGGSGSDWDLVAAQLEPRGHEVVAMDLPCDQEVGFDANVAAVVDAIDGRRGDLVVVAQSMSGFLGPLVCAAIPVELLVLVTAMIPKPGESAAAWWANTGQPDAFAALGLPDATDETVFFHDVPAEVLASQPEPRDMSETMYVEPWPLAAWPDVPTEFLLCRDDRFLPPEWMRGVVRDRLGIEPVEIPGGHCVYLSQPVALADALVGCWERHRREP